jgi:hypothetical protein
VRSRRWKGVGCVCGCVCVGGDGDEREGEVLGKDGKEKVSDTHNTHTIYPTKYDADGSRT